MFYDETLVSQPCQQIPPAPDRRSPVANPPWSTDERRVGPGFGPRRSVPGPGVRRVGKKGWHREREFRGATTCRLSRLPARGLLPEAVQRPQEPPGVFDGPGPIQVREPLGPDELRVGPGAG